jgi:Glyoxalase-like domain
VTVALEPMPASFIKFVTFDCADALVVARFWAAAIGGEVEDDSTSEKAFMEAPGWGGPSMWFNLVPEAKTAKNRLHFDLRAPDTMRAEVERLTSLGASVIHDHGSLVVMADPEGNEFCVEQGPGDLG